MAAGTGVGPGLALSGRKALITGGGSGLGLQIARALGGAGAAVVLASRKEDQLHQARQELLAIGVTTEVAVLDIARPDSIGSLMAHLGTSGEALDILVNCAGTSWAGRALEMESRQWERVLATNLSGPFMLTQSVVREHMAPRGSGVVINVGSVLGRIVTDPALVSQVPYQVSKAGLAMLTKALAVEWASLGVRVNAIAPGWFPTRLTRGLLDQKGAAIAEQVPLRRLGGDDDLGALAVLLSSPGSAYITGQVIEVDGGLGLL